MCNKAEQQRQPIDYTGTDSVCASAEDMQSKALGLIPPLIGNACYTQLLRTMHASNTCQVKYLCQFDTQVCDIHPVLRYCFS